jgi:dephospho-CoA kinase
VSARAVTRPPFIGLTGGIAAGKSEALAAFARAGAETLSTDAAVHELLASADVRERLVERWGESVAPGGEVDRARVGQIVFGDADELVWLESVLHPLVGERIVAWRKALPADARLAVVEVPLLFEGHLAEAFDATVCVVADDELRRRRAAERGTELLEGRSERQLSQEEKAARATHVVRNDGSREDLGAAVARLAEELAGRAEEARS